MVAAVLWDTVLSGELLSLYYILAELNKYWLSKVQSWECW
jgi:hypothetical protein